MMKKINKELETFKIELPEVMIVTNGLWKQEESQEKIFIEQILREASNTPITWETTPQVDRERSFNVFAGEEGMRQFNRALEEQLEDLVTNNWYIDETTNQSQTIMYVDPAAEDSRLHTTFIPAIDIERVYPGTSHFRSDIDIGVPETIDITTRTETELIQLLDNLSREENDI